MLVLVPVDDRLWFALQIEVLKTFTQQELVSWFLEHRNSSSRKLSVHVSKQEAVFLSELHL